ncbi:hypothetical protein DYQ94_08280 [Xanthomonas sp. LMG 8993]|nr:hypothetical protein [Xanthomonas sp. LMG 8993]QWN00448.1 hypothetical protein DGN21_14890 [Xanthomonas sp. MLO165]
MGARALERPRRKRGPGREAGLGVSVRSEAPVALSNARPPAIFHAARPYPTTPASALVGAPATSRQSPTHHCATPPA